MTLTDEIEHESRDMHHIIVALMELCRTIDESSNRIANSIETAAEHNRLTGTDSLVADRLEEISKAIHQLTAATEGP